MSPHFIPQSDSGTLSWMQVFARNISDNPSVYQLMPSDANAIQQAVDAYAAAYAVANDPTTSTVVTVQIKDQTRNSAIQVCRQYARLIKPNAGVSDADKIAIGVRPMNFGRSDIHAPQTSPLLSFIAATPTKHTLFYRDSMTPTSRAKPFGATQLQLFVAIGDVRATDPADAQYYRAFTTTPLEVEFSAPDDGKLATYFARWASRRGDVGPWSTPIAMRIAA